uniref:Spermatogenesis associated 2 n=1 Tax=Callorhinchus milii TaxID=7868 RepID=V9KFT3_CALMI
MDINKYRDSLFQKYVQFCESKLSEGEKDVDDDCLKRAATSLLDLYCLEPSERFKMIRFYDVVENSLKMKKTSSLSVLRNAFGTLETFCINLFLYPWKKEFKRIKTFTGHFVYYVQSAMCEDNIWNILHHVGYCLEKETYELKDTVNTNRVKFISFELFLARIECENLLEIFTQVKDKGYIECNVVAERKNGTEGVKGCIDSMKSRRWMPESLYTSVPRLDFQRSESERLSNNLVKRLMNKPSASVDIYENHLEKPLNKSHLTALSHKKDLIYTPSVEELTEEIFRPTLSLLTMSVSPRGGSDEYMQSSNEGWRVQTNPNTLHALDDDLDLYTAEEPGSTLLPRWTETNSLGMRLTKNNDLKGLYHEAPYHTKENVSSAVALGKCQICGISSGTSVCQKCNKVLCNLCYQQESGESKLYSCRHEYPRSMGHRSLLRTPSVQSDDLSLRSAVKEKCTHPTSTQCQERLPISKSASLLRCGFCDKHGASLTCMNCSKVSCEVCWTVYDQDVCRKNKTHNFLPHNKLGYKIW